MPKLAINMYEADRAEKQDAHDAKQKFHETLVAEAEREYRPDLAEALRASKALEDAEYNLDFANEAEGYDEETRREQTREWTAKHTDALAAYHRHSDELNAEVDGVLNKGKPIENGRETALAAARETAKTSRNPIERVKAGTVLSQLEPYYPEPKERFDYDAKMKAARDGGRPEVAEIIGKVREFDRQKAIFEDLSAKMREPGNLDRNLIAEQMQKAEWRKTEAHLAVQEAGDRHRCGKEAVSFIWHDKPLRDAKARPEVEEAYAREQREAIAAELPSAAHRDRVEAASEEDRQERGEAMSLRDAEQADAQREREQQATAVADAAGQQADHADNVVHGMQEKLAAGIAFPPGYEYMAEVAQQHAAELREQADSALREESYSRMAPEDAESMRLKEANDALAPHELTITKTPFPDYYVYKVDFMEGTAGHEPDGESAFYESSVKDALEQGRKMQEWRDEKYCGTAEQRAAQAEWEAAEANAAEANAAGNGDKPEHKEPESAFDAIRREREAQKNAPEEERKLTR